MGELASRGVVFEQYHQPGIKTDAQGVFDAGRFCWTAGGSLSDAVTIQWRDF
jgi:hypothetical protein